MDYKHVGEFDISVRKDFSILKEIAAQDIPEGTQWTKISATLLLKLLTDSKFCENFLQKKYINLKDKKERVFPCCGSW